VKKPLILIALPLLTVAADRVSHDLSSRAKGNLAEVVSDADYPPSAIRAGEQGIVGFELDVAADGQVAGCRITSSSGSQVLDDTTCRIMIARMHFTPAHDRHGRPVTDRIHSRMKWVLPQEQSEDGNEAVPAETPPS
jgi:protein TonB